MSFPHILIIDDTLDNIKLLAEVLKLEGYCNVEGLTDPAKAIATVRQHEPDLIILDLMMAGTDGYTILRELQAATCEHEFLPVLVVTADHNESTRQRALALGATDFIVRPHQIFDVTLRVRNLLRTRAMYLKCSERNRDLESLICDRTHHLEEVNHHLEEANQRLEESQIELRLAKHDMLERLAQVGEHHDDDTGTHTRRVAHTSFLLAQEMGLPFEESYVLQLAAPLHDVGKIGIPDTILLKQGRLTSEEFGRMKTHCEVGAQLLAGGQSELLHVAQQIALSHHERWDGSGYPYGFWGENIPMEGRIVAVADVFDALTHERPYKEAWPVKDAVNEIARGSGKQFDPHVVDAFCNLDHRALVYPDIALHQTPLLLH